MRSTRGSCSSCRCRRQVKERDSGSREAAREAARARSLHAAAALQARTDQVRAGAAMLRLLPFRLRYCVSKRSGRVATADRPRTEHLGSPLAARPHCESAEIEWRMGRQCVNALNILKRCALSEKKHFEHLAL